MKKERIMYLDALRVVAIISVVVMHICAMDWYVAPVTSFHWQVLNFYDGLVRFCVPVFIMISGAFLLDPDKSYNIKNIFTNKISRVLVAFLFWSAMYIVVCNTIEPKGAGEFIEKWLSGSTYHLWFPYAIIGLYLITPFLREIVKKKKLCEYFIILWFLGASLSMALKVIPDTPQVLLTVSKKVFPDFVLGYAGYYVLGYYLSKYKMPKVVHGVSYLLAILGVAVTVVGTYYLSTEANEATSKLYEYLMPNVAFVSIGIFLLFKALIKNNSTGSAGESIIKTLSRLSFGIYLVHEMFIYLIEDVMKYTTDIINPILCVPLISLVVFVLSVAITFVMSKIPFVNKYLM